LTATDKIPSTSQRFVALDFMRGLIMVLLALESAKLYDHLHDASEGYVLQHFFSQFFHHPWNGLRFWDLIQPGFMFIAGTAMAFSLHRQKERGVPWSTSFKKILKRCGWLFFWGVLNYAVEGNNRLSFELWNVLTQLSFTTLIAFLVFRWSFRAQLSVCIGLLVLTEVLYRYTNIPGFNQPFTDQHNFGNYMDLVLMNKINNDGWVAINCIPTAVHTIGGAIAGKWLLRNRTNILPLVYWGTACVIGGYMLDITNVTPIIKRIATSSFTIVTLGWCLLALVGIYWWIDLKNHQRRLSFFTIVGMNSLFIYLFFEIVGARWLNDYIGNITYGLMAFTEIPLIVQGIITSLLIFSLEWYLCYFLFRKKIFFKI
jgi:predicted acyltransferase